MKDMKWEVEKYSLSKITMAFLPKRMPVLDATGDAIGYTSQREGIFIAKKHEIFSMLKPNEQQFFRKGVFAHELLHQIFTNFDYHKAVIDSLEPYERNVFALIANILEDPAIENWAKTKFGGSLLRSLKFSIAHIYDQSPSISDPEMASNAFSQFINALIQFGDMGLIKGEFTFPEAKQTFLDVAPIFNGGILEADNKKRLDIAKVIMDMSRPLWEEQAKDEQAFKDALEKLMEAAGKNEMSGSGSGEAGDSDLLPDGDKKESRRGKTLAKIKISSEKSDSGDSDASCYDSTDSMGNSEDADISSEKSPKKASSDDSSSSESSTESEKEAEKDVLEDKTSDADAVNEDKQLSKDDAEEIKKELSQAEDEMKKKKEEEKQDSSDLLSTSLKCDKVIISAADIKNKRTSSGDPDIYEYIVSSMKTGITNTTKQIKKMISFAQEETEYATRGKINIKRLNSGKNTARVFDKKRVPNDTADIIVGVAVDQSGSMWRYDKITHARECCIALAEICNNLNIPIYIMGYTGDCEGARLVHSHFITWKNSKSDRLSLVNIAAKCENLDGPSFRYFTEIMRKKQAKHKLMIIVSDGQPCGSGYYGEYANKDTILAIKDARKVCDVLGVAVGDSDTALLHSFYEGDFLHVGCPNDLFSKIASKLKKFVKKWIDEE